MKINVDFFKFHFIASFYSTKYIHALHSNKIRVSSDCATFVIVKAVFISIWEEQAIKFNSSDTLFPGMKALSPISALPLCHNIQQAPLPTRSSSLS